jgi:hypothetical protein
MHNRHRFIIATTAVALLASSGTHADVYDFRIVAESGDPAPGTLGGSFVWLTTPSINASGQVAFRADTTGPLADSGIWKTASANPQLIQFVIGEDYPVPGSNGAHFGSISVCCYGPYLNDNGNIGFSAPVGAGIGNPGVFRMVDGIIEKIAIPGDAMPGVPGATIASVGNLIAFNDDDLLTSRVVMTGAGVNDGNNSGILLTWFGGLQLVAREGNGAPGIPGTTFGDFSFTLPTIGINGQVAFDVPLIGASAADTSRWRGWPGLLNCLVKEGDPTPIGGTFGGSIPNFWTMSLSASGAAFEETANLPTGAIGGIWHASGGANSQIIPLAVQGGAGPLGVYDTISTSTIRTASDGTTIFVARFSGPGVNQNNDTALLQASPGENTKVLFREGTAPYGFGAGVQFEDMVQAFSAPSWAITDSGWSLIRAKVRGLGINPSNDTGVWTIDPEGEVHFIARTGMLLTLEGEPARLVESLAPNFQIGHQSGRRSSINENGDVALSIDFTNGDSVIVAAQLPDPCPGDINGDGVVDATDLAILLGGWGVFGPIGTGGDVDRDGDTDAVDLGTLLGSWGPCPN